MPAPPTNVLALLGPNRRDFLSLEGIGVGGSQSHDTSLVTGYANASMRMNTANNSNGSRSIALGGAYDHLIIAADCYRNGANGVNTVWNYGIGFDLAASSNTFVLSAAGRDNANHQILSTGPTLRGTSGLAVVTGTWTRVMLAVRLHATLGYIRLYVGGWDNLITSFEGDTIAAVGTSTFDRALLIGNGQGRICNVVASSTTPDTFALDRLRLWNAGVWLQSPAAAGAVSQQQSGTFADVNSVPISFASGVVMRNQREVSFRMAAPPATAKSALAAELFWSGTRESINIVNGVRLFLSDGPNRELSAVYPTPISTTWGDWLRTTSPSGSPLRLEDVSATNWQWGYKAGTP